MANILILMPNITGTNAEVWRNTVQRISKIDIVENIQHQTIARSRAMSWLTKALFNVGLGIILTITTFKLHTQTVAIAPAKA